MDHPGFHERAGPFPLAELADRIEVEPVDAAHAGLLIHNVRPLSDAGPSELTFLDNRKYAPQLAGTRAGACLILPELAGGVPAGTVAVRARSPYRSFALALQAFYPGAMRHRAAPAGQGAAVHATARLEDGVEVEPGAVIGPEAWIGRGTTIGAGAVVGYRCYIGRDCFIGPQSTVICALIGDRVIIHPGVRIGQDGFGFAMGRSGHLKVPQVGRVVIQNDVEIGANCTIDRGALKDTIIGEGTKIDNLVQIGHNVVIGRHCVIVAQVGISGSAEVGDFVVMGGQSGLVGHIKVGDGAQIAGAAHAKDDVPAGARMGGTPARPMRQWAREVAALRRLGRAGAAGGVREDKD